MKVRAKFWECEKHCTHHVNKIDLNIDLLVECYHYAKYIVDDVEEGGVQGNAGMCRDVQGRAGMCEDVQEEVRGGGGEINYLH